MNAHSPIVSVRGPIVGPDRVTSVMASLLHKAIHEGPWSYETLELASGVPVRTIRSYMGAEPRQPSVSNALSLCCVLGSQAVNALVNVIGYSATAQEDPDQPQPIEIITDALEHLTVLHKVCADNRVDHHEEPESTAAADALILTVLPLSSAGRAA